MNRDTDSFFKKLGEPPDPVQVKQSTGRVASALRAAYRGAPLQEADVEFWGVRRSTRRWYGAAVAATLVVAFVLWQFVFVRQDVFAVVESIDGEWHVVAASSTRPLHQGERIEGADVVRTHAGGVLRLPDGSRVELSSGTEVSLHPASDGLEIRLTTGKIIVTAARQFNGHLYVKAPDCTVSVLGTVFSVNAETLGSRVSVIQGQVEVQLGAEAKRLQPGQQVATSPAVPIVPLKEEIGWSRNATAHIALLEQSGLLFVATQSTAVPGVVAGFVKQMDGAGIPGVSITLCLTSDLVAAPTAVLPSRENIGEIRIGANVVEYRDRLGNPINPPDPECRKPLQATADAAGRFAIGPVLSGEYNVRAQREGFLGLSYKGTGQPGAVTSVTVAADRVGPEVALTLLESVAISGQVRDERGRPLPNAVVEALEVVGYGVDASLRLVSSRLSDDRGEYRLFGLPPGEYHVAARKPATVTFGQPASEVERTFYPGTLEAVAARTVAAKSGVEVQGIDIDLKSVPLGRISGTVTSDIPGVTNARLSLVSRSPLQPSSATTQILGVVTITQGAGVFGFSEILPGPYDLIATSRCQPTTPSISARPGNERELAAYLQQLAVVNTDCVGGTPIEVRSGELSGLTLRLQPRVDVGGKITAAGIAIQPGDAQLSLAARGRAAAAGYSRVSAFTPPMGDALAFIFGKVPPGHFTLEVRLAGQLQNAYVSDIRLEGNSVLTSGFDVGTEAPPPLEVSVGLNGGTVSGIVRNAAQQSAPGAFVALIPQSARRQNRSLYPTASSDTNGQFTIRGIAPGDYKLLAFPQNSDDSFFNPATQLRLDVLSQPLKIAPGSNTTNLQVVVAQ